MNVPTHRQAKGCELSIAQVLAENLACHPSLMRWLTRRVLPELSVDLAPDGVATEIARATHLSDPGWDIKVIGDFGPIDIAFLIAVRLDYRASLARKAKEAAQATSESGEAAVAISIWLTAAARAARMADEPSHYDRTVPLEAVLETLRAEARCSAYELQRRREFQIGLIEAALAKGATVADAPADPRETFRADYLDMIADQAPLLLVEQAREAADPVFDMVVFDVATVPRWPFLPPVRLAHHLREGVASILIHEWGADLDGLAAVMEPALDGTPYGIALAPSRLPGGKPGVLILVDTPPLDPERPMDAQRRAARDCIRAIDALRGWFASRKAVVGYWADFVGGQARDQDIGHKRVRRGLDLG